MFRDEYEAGWDVSDETRQCSGVDARASAAKIMACSGEVFLTRGNNNGAVWDRRSCTGVPRSLRRSQTETRGTLWRVPDESLRTSDGWPLQGANWLHCGDPLSSRPNAVLHGPPTWSPTRDQVIRKKSQKEGSQRLRFQYSDNWEEKKRYFKLA